MKLTAREQAWAEAYLVTLNKAESARRAKYKGDNVQLANIGWQNYRKAHIRAYLKDRLDEMCMPANEILVRYTDMASSNISEFAHVSTHRDLAELENGYLVKKFKRKITRTQSGGEYEEIELELYDAKSALDSLAKYHHLLTDKIEITWKDEISILVRKGIITQQDIINEFAGEVPQGLLESFGIQPNEVGKAEVDSSIEASE